MSLPTYFSYAPTGSEQLGLLPTHWEVIPLKRCFNIFGGSTPKSDEVAYWDGDIVWVSPADLSKLSSRYIGDSSRKITEAGMNSCGTTLVPANSIVLSTRAPIGSLAIASTALCTNQGCKSLVPRANVDSSFYAYFLMASTEALNVRGKGTTFLELSSDELASYRVPYPPLGEQTAIAAFLDRETSKIDALIAEQEKLLELLAEKRHATISHAVTRGLNPDVPMKDSGVEWLGEVPQHWAVQSIKHLVSVPITDGPHETPNFLDEGIPFVSAEAVSGGFINFEKIRGYISTEDHQRYSAKYKPQLNDIYMVKSGATTGVTAIVESDTEFNIWSPLAAIRCDKQKAEPYFVLAALRSRNFQEGVTLNWRFGTQQNIGMGVLGDLRIALPPLSEQREIAAFLALETPKLNVLSVEAERMIALLKERRSALIAAAVTGKIDVREHSSVLAAAA
ncbi:restriction endonuclease subunit S [Burkholderia multivorans]|uniref:restriction endonuclease subunit S n=1 Tax=Burkholderia multivorans TaxID=87883 RepID=UPI0009C085BD|nr:restriction endonuclease subunit S [Burkholderia multivorans]